MISVRGAYNRKDGVPGSTLIPGRHDITRYIKDMDSRNEARARNIERSTSEDRINALKDEHRRILKIPSTLDVKDRKMVPGRNLVAYIGMDGVYRQIHA